MIEKEKKIIVLLGIKMPDLWHVNIYYYAE